MSVVKRNNRTFSSGVLALFFVVSGMISPALQAENPNGIAVTLSGPEEYTPGSEIEIEVSITEANPGYLGSFGLQLDVPTQWGHVETQPAPDVVRNDVAGVLEYAWITPPDFPHTMTITLQTHTADNHSQIVEASAPYYTNASTLMSSEVAQTVIWPVGATEGEGEGEGEGEDSTPPEIVLLGDNPINWVLGVPFVDPGWEAIDDSDGDISSQVAVEGHVQFLTPGEYELTYTVSDSSGNAATPVVRTVAIMNEKCFFLCGFAGNAPSTLTGDMLVLFAVALVLGGWRYRRIVAPRR